MRIRAPARMELQLPAIPAPDVEKIYAFNGVWRPSLYMQWACPVRSKAQVYEAKKAIDDSSDDAQVLVSARALHGRKFEQRMCRGQ